MNIECLNSIVCFQEMLTQSLKFADLCVLLSKLRDAKGPNASSIRKKTFEKFLEGCRDKCGDEEDFDTAIHPVGKDF